MPLYPWVPAKATASQDTSQNNGGMGGCVCEMYSALFTAEAVKRRSIFHDPKCLLCSLKPSSVSAQRCHSLKPLQSCPVPLGCPYWKGGPETPWAIPVCACRWVCTQARARAHTRMYVLVFSCQLPFTYNQKLNKDRLENRWKSQNYLQATREIF